ncbi:globin domain-containing protein [Zhihengliuella flava]|uniref:nitric oxide dioxygenase n=1 Tax=Zhihengliuella flava TaxID=1285193 RepID=A0A931D7N3_9MICC|nr:globin domain-containing protein [Zhihengliuella flava]MBG6085180.1 nitric oxide dioxygenase [Zhihengliuella flava]
MLSAKSRPVIEATLPVVGEHLEEITRTFYADLFAAHPELLDGLFSRSNQRNGAQQQALAGSIAAFATHLLAHPDSLPEAVLSRIAHKHASLGITEDQYEVVYHYLFGAIARVLGDAVTEEVADAWTEVYWLMADALIKIERGLTAQQANTQPWSPWILTARRPAGTRAVTLHFTPGDSTPPSAALPGQYVSLRVQLPGDLRQVRQYTLSDAVTEPNERRITVKLDDAGEVSGVLHHHLAIGDVVELSNPYGDLTLDPDQTSPLILATAGIGCTPAAAALSALAAIGSERRVIVLHSESHRHHWALEEQMRAHVDALPHAELRLWLGDTTGSPDASASPMRFDDLDLPVDAQAYLCGPLPFMRAARSQLVDAGVAAHRISYEVFGPDLWLTN